MKFMVFVRANTYSEAGEPPPPKLMAVIGKLAEEGFKNGTLVSTGGLLPSSQGARLRLSNAKINVTDGPFAEAKELVGGWAIIQAKSREEAVEQVKAFMKVHTDVMGPSWEMECELRGMAEPPRGTS
ncbi:MAG TPA: YciI family protein [Polyangiaceae bacterium]|jgi:hypothetical protein